MFVFTENLALHGFLESIRYATQTVKNYHPNSIVIWILPFPHDFLFYNFYILQKFGISEVDDDDFSKWRNYCKIFYNYIQFLEERISQEEKNIKFIFLNELFFDGNENCKKNKILFEESLKGEKQIAWPNNKTVDGFHPTEEFTHLFSKKILNLLVEYNLWYV